MAKTVTSRRKSWVTCCSSFAKRYRCSSGGILQNASRHLGLLQRVPKLAHEAACPAIAEAVANAQHSQVRVHDFARHTRSATYLAANAKKDISKGQEDSGIQGAWAAKSRLCGGVPSARVEEAKKCSCGESEMSDFDLAAPVLVTNFRHTSDVGAYAPHLHRSSRCRDNLVLKTTKIAKRKARVLSRSIW